MSRLTYKQVAQAITQKLQTKFAQIPILQEDVPDGSASSSAGFKFLRPSFKVTFEAGSSDERLYNSHRTMNCRILFFPTSLYDYSIEFLDTQEGLEETFALTLPVQDRTLTIESSDSQQIGDPTQQKVLEFTFSLAWYDDPVNPPAESTYTIEELDWTLTDEGDTNG